MSERPLRLALIGAFPFPYPQGSQVFFREQARALGAAGARCTLITYASGVGEVDPGLDLVTPSAWTAPRGMRSGPHPGKPLADLAMVNAFLAAHRQRGFAAAIAHNAEAALVALAARPFRGVPVIYCAHTILEYELSAYLPSAVADLASRVGAGIDRWIARRADAVIALSDGAANVLRDLAPATPVAVLPPGLEPAPAVSEDAERKACEAHGLEWRGFALYSGNLDGYQELGIFDRAARELGTEEPACVVASHDPDAPARARALGLDQLHVLVVRDRDEMRALCHAAGVLVMTRRRPGGFPIKLLGYMEAARPIISFEEIAVGMRHLEHAWLLPRHAGGRDVAEAIRQLTAIEDLAETLGTGARRLLRERHDWEAIAADTIGFIRERVASCPPIAPFRD